MATKYVPSTQRRVNSNIFDVIKVLIFHETEVPVSVKLCRKENNPSFNLNERLSIDLEIDLLSFYLPGTETFLNLS